MDKKVTYPSLEVIFMRYSRGCARAVEIRNETIRSELNIFANNDILVLEENIKWKYRVARMT